MNVVEGDVIMGFLSTVQNLATGHPITTVAATSGVISGLISAAVEARDQRRYDFVEQGTGPVISAGLQTGVILGAVAAGACHVVRLYSPSLDSFPDAERIAAGAVSIGLLAGGLQFMNALRCGVFDRIWRDTTTSFGLGLGYGALVTGFFHLLS